MAQSNFVHLHNHTMYSLLDGALRISDMARRAVDWGMPALAITDHGSMFGAIEFYKKMKEAGLKPIIGCEFYVAIEGRRSRKAARGMNDGANHLILLARDNTGYQNLMKLASLGYLEGFYYHPRVDKELLREHSEGLLALSACINGEIAHLILMGHPEKSKEVASEYQDIFGRDNFYLEIQRHGLEDEDRVNEVLIDLSRELKIPLVATNDAHYLERDHARAHEVLLCIQTGKILEDEDRMRFRSDEIYLKSPREMEELFSDVPEALENTVGIAGSCNVEIELGKVHLPAYRLPEGYDDPDRYLEDLSWRGLKERYDEINTEIEERLKFEIETIKKMGYSGYFLIVADFVGYARENKIPVGARGSVTGSIVAYSLKITDIDPIKYGLLFERFLNPDRVSMPDIDIDFADWGRERIINYVIDKYGSESVCQIITFGTLAARGVIRDVGRVLNMPYGEVDRIAKQVPPDLGMTLHRALELSSGLRQLAESDGIESTLISYARTLEGLARHASVHAAGVVIAPGTLTDYVPLYKSNKGQISTQYDYRGVADIGLVKIDFLGLTELTIIDDTVKMIRGRGEEIDIENLPLNDQETFDLLSRGETTAIFQFEKSWMRDYLRRLKPNRLDDLIAMNALNRPGPMAFIPDYIARKNGTRDVEYDHPLLEPILKETYGIIVYQEQVMQIASELGGFTLAQADLLRQAMGKKQHDVMAKQREVFIKGCLERGVERETADSIFNAMAQFAGYGFNKSHSAGYALVAYQDAYLKAHYPKEFMAANLTNEMGDSDRVAILIDECRRMGIDVLPPDVNDSAADFKVVEGGIRFGLAAVKNVGGGAAQSIVDAREKQGSFKTIFDFCERVDLRSLNRRAIESLIFSGAMDSLKGHRAQFVAVLDQAIEAAQSVQADRERGQISLFKTAGVDDRTSILPQVQMWTESELLAREKEALGLFISGHPLDRYKDDLKAFATHSALSLREARGGSQVRVGGIITAVKPNTDRNGRRMAFVSLEDLSGAIEVVVFSDVYEKYRSLIRTDSIVLVRGRTVVGDGKSDIRAEEFLPLEEVREKFVHSINISISSDGLDREMLLKLKDLCQQHPGSCPLLIHLDEGNRRKFVIKSGNVAVSPSDELLSELKAELGDDRVWVG